MWFLILMITIFVSTMIIGRAIHRFSDKGNWNNGECLQCSGELYKVNPHSNYFRCDNNHYVWISCFTNISNDGKIQ